MSGVTELVVRGGSPLRGRLRMPGDKGMSHRALLFAAMATGSSRLTHVASGDDVQRTARALDDLGVRVRADDNSAMTINGTGVEGMHEPAGIIDCGNSGTTIRMLAGLLAGRPFRAVLSGDASLVTRPMRRVVEPLLAMGAQIEGRGDGDLAPLAIRGGHLVGVRCELSVASAQVKTAVVLAGLQATGDTVVTEPVPSRDHSERMLAALGAPVERVDATTLRVRHGAPDPFEFEVPGDASSAAFFAVAAAITPGSSIVLAEVGLNPTRIAFVDVLRRMGARIEVRETGERLGEPVGELTVEAAVLTATVIEGGEVPWLIDEIPALAVAAAFAEGTTEIRDAAELRVKESDRIGTLHQELTQMGIEVVPAADGLAIRGGTPRPATLKSHGDHRIAMAAAIAGLGVEGETTVRGWRAVDSSYPEFERDLAMLRTT